MSSSWGGQGGVSFLAGWARTICTSRSPIRDGRCDPLTVLFDMFGVLARHQSVEGKDRLVRVAGAPATAFWDAYWARRHPYDRGDVTAEEYWNEVAQDLGVRFDRERVNALVEADVASWREIDPTMVALVEELVGAGRRVGLLSNIPEELAVHYEAHHPWLAHFHVRAFSCRIRRAKPEAEAYLWCRDALGVEADRILFVDDRLENVRAAREVGMHGHVFTDAELFVQELARWDGRG